MLTESKLKSYNLSNLMKVAKSWVGDIGNPAYTELLPVLENLIRSKGGTMPKPSDLTKVAIPTGKLSKLNVSLKIQEDLQVAKRFVNACISAGERNIEWDLTLADVRRLMRRKVCAYTGLRFEDTDKLRMTLERIDNKKGYTTENVIPVCFFANQLKNEMVERVHGKFYMSEEVAVNFIRNAFPKST